MGYGLIYNFGSLQMSHRGQEFVQLNERINELKTQRIK